MKFFGSRMQLSVDERGGYVLVDTRYRGHSISTVTMHEESVIIDDQPHLLAQVLQHLEWCKQKGYVDPYFEMSTDPETGKIKRLVKGYKQIS